MKPALASGHETVRFVLVSVQADGRTAGAQQAVRSQRGVAAISAEDNPTL